MTKTEILERLTPIFRDVFADDAMLLDESMNADGVEGWDSFHHINLIAAIEDEFGLRFRTGEIDSLTGVRELVTVIGLKLP